MPTQHPPAPPATSETDFRTSADTAVSRGEHAVALSLWSEARLRYPTAPWPWLRAADTLRRLRRFTEADALLDQAIDRFPGDFWLARMHALVAWDQDDDVEAFVRSRALCRRFPDNAAAPALLVQLMLKSQQVPAAEAEAEAGLARFPDAAWLRHMYALCADRAGDLAAAASRWTDLLIQHPEHEPAYVPAVHALIRLQHLDEATGIAREALRFSPNAVGSKAAWAELCRAMPEAVAAPVADAPAINLLAAAITADRLQQWATATRLWASLRELLPALAEAYAGGARSLLHLGRAAEAEIVLARARRDLPPHAGVLQVWADAAADRGAATEAVRRFQALQQAFPSAFCAALGLGRALRALRRFDEADATFAALVRDHPADLSAAEQFATLAVERGDRPEAIRRWSALISRFPDHLPAYRHLAEALLTAGRPAEADAVLSDARARFQDDLEMTLRWVIAAQHATTADSQTARWDELCRHFPAIGALLRPQPGPGS